MLRIPRGLLVTLLLGAFVVPAGWAEGGPATFAEARALAAKENKPLLLDFIAVW